MLYNFRYKTYHTRAGLYTGIYNALVRHFLEDPLNKDSYKILEIGSNSPGSIASMLRHFHIPIDELTVVNYPEVDIQSMPEEYYGRYDFLITDQTLYCVKRPWLAVEEMKKVLVPGGIAINATPFWYPLCPQPLDCFRIGPDGYRVLFEEGWEIIDIGSWGSLNFLKWAFENRFDKLDDRYVDLLSGAHVNEVSLKIHEHDDKYPIQVWCIAKKQLEV